MSDYFEIMRRAQGQQVVRRVVRKKRVRIDPDSVHELAREELVKLVQRVFLFPHKEKRQAILFVGVEHGTGCTSICARAGEALASQVEGSVCVVDANSHTPSLHALYDLNNVRGLTDALSRPEPIKEFTLQIHSSNLWILPFGQRSLDFASTSTIDRFRARVNELRAIFPYVLADVPPVNRCPEAVHLARHMDGVILVLESNSTRRVAARRAKESLDSANARILGAVLNKRTFPIPNFLYERL